MAKCKYFETPEFFDGNCPRKKGSNVCWGMGKTTEICDIISKPKYKRVVAALTHIPKVGAETQMVSIDLKAIKAGWIPCTILIDKKYLKGAK